VAVVEKKAMEEQAGAIFRRHHSTDYRCSKKTTAQILVCVLHWEETPWGCCRVALHKLE
jgi:hypothetical protein